MRRTFPLLPAALAVLAISGTASAHPLRTLFCCNGGGYHERIVIRNHQYGPTAPMAFAPARPAGSFGSTGFGAVTFGAPVFGTVGFGSTGFGSGGFGSPVFGWVPMTLVPTTGGGGSGNNTGFGSSDEAFGIDPVTILALSRMGIDLIGQIRERRANAGTPAPLTGRPNTGTPAPLGGGLSTADLAGINQKLDALNLKVDAMIIGNAVTTSELLKRLDEIKAKIK
jgi:hypothetical protein